MPNCEIFGKLQEKMMVGLLLALENTHNETGLFFLSDSESGRGVSFLNSMVMEGGWGRLKLIPTEVMMTKLAGSADRYPLLTGLSTGKAIWISPWDEGD